jgi:hypothetical protein
MESTAQALHDFALVCGDVISANYIRCVSPVDMAMTRHIASEIRSVTSSVLLQKKIDNLLNQREVFTQ